MSSDSYEAFITAFPSTELLCMLLGFESEDAFFETHYKAAARHVRRGEILHVFPHDVAIAEAHTSGVLIVRKGKRGQEIFELDKELYRKNHNLFKELRVACYSMFILSAFTRMRRQKYSLKPGDQLQPVYIFKDGAYADPARVKEDGIDTTDKALCEKLCGELTAALTKHPLHADIWWEWKIKNDSVWLQPKELTDELKAAMQKLYEEKRAKHWFVTTEFYPGWEPDTSNDLPDAVRPAKETRLT